MTFNELRHATRLTHQQIADIADVKTRQVYRWIKGEAPAPKLVVEALERVLSEKQAIK